MPLHNIPPVFDENSEILILGSFPSVKSRETEFFYGHPQNRFWRVLSEVLGAPLPASVAEKRALLLENRVALWDAVASCDISGSADTSIKNAVPNDLSLVLGAARIRKIFTNGGAADRLYSKLCLPQTGRPAVRLPSTSPANAGFSLERLVEAWGVIKKEP